MFWTNTILHRILVFMFKFEFRWSNTYHFLRWRTTSPEFSSFPVSFPMQFSNKCRHQFVQEFSQFDGMSTKISCLIVRIQRPEHEFKFFENLCIVVHDRNDPFDTGVDVNCQFLAWTHLFVIHWQIKGMVNSEKTKTIISLGKYLIVITYNEDWSILHI